mmetsp:Transcript_42478/g.49637  ORF Transcript_42478/g.49637 Transcript_42478/m.49637 type:complete len:133 (-) Transcript_42478:151-549(-)
MALYNIVLLHLRGRAPVFAAHVHNQTDVVGFGGQGGNIAGKRQRALHDGVIQNIAKGCQQPHTEEFPTYVACNHQWHVEKGLHDKGPEWTVLIPPIVQGYSVHGEIECECVICRQCDSNHGQQQPDQAYKRQ